MPRKKTQKDNQEIDTELLADPKFKNYLDYLYSRDLTLKNPIVSYCKECLHQYSCQDINRNQTKEENLPYPEHIAIPLNLDSEAFDYNKIRNPLNHHCVNWRKKGEESKDLFRFNDKPNYSSYVNQIEDQSYYWILSTKESKRQFLIDQYKFPKKHVSIIVDLLDAKVKKYKKEEKKKKKDSAISADDILALPDWEAKKRIENYSRVKKKEEEKKEEHTFRIWIEDGKIQYVIDNSICLPPNTALSQECFQNLLKMNKIPEIEIRNLFEKMKEKHSEFVYLDEHSLINGTLKSICSFFPEVFSTVPYTDIFSPEYGSGKTTYMMVCVLSSYHGIVNTDPTGAVLYRNLRDIRCTIGIDEVDRFNSKTDQNIIAIVNSSNIKGITVPRVNLEKDTIEYYDPFGVKYFTRVGNMPNPAWTHRSDPVSMVECKGRKDLKKYPKPEDFKDLRDQSYLLRLTHISRIREVYQDLQEQRILKDRNGDIYLPMLTIAKLVSDEIYRKALKYAQNQWIKTSLKSKDIFNETLVRVLHKNEELQGNTIKGKDISDAFNEDLGELGLLFKTKDGNFKEFSVRQVYNKLRNLGFEDSTAKPQGFTHFDIRPDKLEDLLLVYDIPSGEQSEESEQKKGISMGDPQDDEFEKVDGEAPYLPLETYI